MHVLFVEPIHPLAIDWLSDKGVEVLHAYEGDEWRGQADLVRALCYRSAVVDAALLDLVPSLEVVAKYGVGTNTVDFAETTARGIKVTNVPGVNANTVSEHAIMLLAAASRSLVRTDRAVREGRFHDRLEMPLFNELSSTRLGLVGGGRIGQRVAAIAHAGYQCSIAVYDPYVDPSNLAPFGAQMFDTVDELFTWANNAVIAAPLTAHNARSIGLAQLECLGADGVLVISSRGGIVDETALTEALRTGVIRGAGVDVFDPEPPQPGNPLFELDNVVLTPHLAGSSRQSRELQAIRLCEQVWSLLNGGDAPLAGQEPWM